jgi:hypothetical protein
MANIIKLPSKEFRRVFSLLALVITAACICGFMYYYSIPSCREPFCDIYPRLRAIGVTIIMSFVFGYGVTCFLFVKNSIHYAAIKAIMGGVYSLLAFTLSLAGSFFSFYLYNKLFGYGDHEVYEYGTFIIILFILLNIQSFLTRRAIKRSLVAKPPSAESKSADYGSMPVAPPQLDRPEIAHEHTLSNSVDTSGNHNADQSDQNPPVAPNSSS